MRGSTVHCMFGCLFFFYSDCKRRSTDVAVPSHLGLYYKKTTVADNLVLGLKGLHGFDDIFTWVPPLLCVSYTCKHVCHFSLIVPTNLLSLFGMIVPALCFRVKYNAHSWFRFTHS